MSTFIRRNEIKSYKLRLQKKLKTVTEETENVTLLLNSCVEKFEKRVQHILEIKDEKCLSLYRQLNKDLEDFSERLFIFQGSFEEATEDEESDSSEDIVAADVKLKETAPKSLSRHPSQNESLSNIPSLKYENTKTNEAIDLQSQQENTNVQLPSKEYETRQRFSEENSYEHMCPESSITKSSSVNEDGGNITEDDFHSLNSDNNVNKTNSCTLFSSNLHNEHVSEKECTSSISFSHSSYRSVSSNISEPLPLRKETTSNQSVETHIVEDKNEWSLNSKESCLFINPPNFAVGSKFSGTLSCIIDPGNFWIEVENSHMYKLNFPKSEYAKPNGLSSIKTGTYCLAPLKSKSAPFYYRALSLSDGKCGKDFVKVIFIDRGSTEEVFVSDLQPLPAHANKIPAQAIHCFLYGIKPAGDAWSRKSTERFKKFRNFCIDVVVKSKSEQSLYGVHLMGKMPAVLDEANLDVDIADTLYIEKLAQPINESQPSHDKFFESEVPKLCSEINLSLNALDSRDLNAISHDSGVSVTSIDKSNQVSTERNENILKLSENNINMELDKNISDSQNAMQVNDLISFLTEEDLCNPQSSNAIFKAPDNLFSSQCNGNFSLHFKVLFPSLMFVEKDKVIVMVSHIVNPHEFYVNMAMKDIENFDDLREQMNTTYNSEKNVPRVEIQDLAEGMFCAGLFNDDDHWYRIKILRISTEDKEKNQVLAQYIDYGNISVIQCCHIRPLTKEFSKQPTFAIKCALAGVKPIKDTASNNDSDWNEAAINFFKELTLFEFQRCLTAEIRNDVTIINAYTVLLWDIKERDSGDLLINAALAEHKMAEFDYTLVSTTATQEVKELEPDSIDSWDPMSEEYHHTDNNYDVDDENIEIMTTGHQSKDLEYICKYFAMRGHCPRGSNCDLQHVPLLDVTRDKEGVYCLDTVPIAENVNDVLVQVSTIYTPSHFYVILPFGGKSVDELDILALKGPSKNTIIYSEMKALFFDMDKHYSKAPFKENTTVALSCGTIVAAKRQQDGKWHRGRIVEVNDTIKPSKVFFVDFGDEEWVSRKSIRTILPQYLHTPFQAVQCSLHGIEPFESEKGVSWNTQSVNYFKGIVSGQVLLAKITQRFEKVFHISLRRTSQNDHSDIAKFLVSAGYAQYTTKVTRPVKKKVLYVPG